MISIGNKKRKTAACSEGGKKLEVWREEAEKVQIDWHKEKVKMVSREPEVEKDTHMVPGKAK